MTTELTLHQDQTDIASQMQWAQAVVARNDGAAQSILPEAYRNNPANVLIAVGLGQPMGLSFAESLYRINVIKGKPSAAAELIAANVRKAGHKLRVQVTENPPSATATIVRADDPDYPTVIERDMAWAQRMGLTGEPNYKKQPSTMLSYRAITACARLACPEALYGVAYTPDEVESIPGSVTASSHTPSAPAAPATAADFIATPAATPSTEPEPIDVTYAEVVEDEPEPITPAQLKALGASMTAMGLTQRDARLEYAARIVGRPLASSKDLSKSEASAVIDAAKADADDAEGQA